MQSVPGEMVVYPWISLKSSLTICGVTFLPRGVATERAGAQLGQNVERGTSYFYDNVMDGAPDFGFGPLALRRLEPTVVLLGDPVTRSRVELANLAWFLPVLFSNSRAHGYSNATNFQHFSQRLGGPSMLFARRTRQMHGYKLAGAMVANIVNVKPQWCGDYHEPDAEMLALLENIIDRGDAQPIRESLKALLSAATDDDTRLPDEEHAHYARSVERLLHRAGQNGKTRNAEQCRLGNDLLSRLLPAHTGPWQIMSVRDAIRNRRNDFWHPESRKNAIHPFEKQTAVHRNLIAFRAVTALVIASANGLSSYTVSDKLRSYVAAVEEWIASIKEDEPRSAEDVSDLSGIWARICLENTTAAFLRDHPDGSEFV